VQETNSTDPDKLAAYIRANTFQTVVGDVAFGKDGEWAKSRQSSPCPTAPLSD
jgi:branched-chain amino acid transport system substrate-binding protein